MLKKTILLLLVLLITSCGGTFDSVKRGLTGEKKTSADEFLVEKKDPLILPPDFENLPTPEDDLKEIDEASIFEKKIEESIDESVSGSSSVEQSILRKIRSK